MFEGKHIHYSPLNKKPLCSYSAKLCKQRRINGYAFCIRHILEDKSAPFKQCAHVARYNKQKCTNPIPCNENREFCNSHMQVAGMLPKKERKVKKEKEKEVLLSVEGKLKFSDRLKALLTKENSTSCNEDTLNSDDPYAFPDTISENENGCIGFSATPILRNAWNCSQKSSPDVSSIDSPSRCDQPSKNTPSSESKLKSNAPTLSKTMNRLHAKIAQNKLLDKQKKTQDSSQSTISLINAHLHAINNVKIEPMSPLENNSINSESNESKMIPDNIKEIIIKMEPMEDNIESEQVTVSTYPSPNVPSFLQADSQMSSGMNSSSSEKYFCNREKLPVSSDVNSKEKLQLESDKQKKSDTANKIRIPIVLRKLQRIFKNRKKQNKYIFPSGLYSSESDSSDSDEESHLFNQLSRFCVWDQHSSNSLQNMKSDSRPAQHSQLKTEFLRSYYQLCRLHSLQKQERERQQEIILPLTEAARAYPDQATEILSNYSKNHQKQKKIDKPIHTTKKTCSFKHEEMSCSNPVLPYTWHCKKHITYNVDQLLFEHCTAKFSDNTQCCVPVFDVCHELPLCFEHAKKRDNYNKMASEPKPKKPRKKPKPSALTRPPKRGKKKKKPTSVRPTTLPLPLPPSLPSTSHPSSSQLTEMPNVNSFSNEAVKSTGTVLPISDLNKEINGELHAELGSDLEDFSPGAIEKTLELPLDTAELANHASKLLDEHDFTEVLNKIPDDAFNDLFVDTRNGDYIPTREETEELERALAAVSKDVHLAKESLAKLSSSTTGPDLEELERTIEIHGSLLGADNLTSAIDENSFADLPNNHHMDTLNVISSSFSTSDLNSLSQVFSAIPESLDQNHLPTVTENSLVPNSVSIPLSNSELSHSHMLNGHSDILAGLHPLQLDPTFSNNLLNTSTGLSLTHPGTVDNKLFTNGSLLSTMFYNIGQVSSNTPPPQPQTFSVASISGSNTSDEVGLMSSSGGLNNSNHWLLNSPDVLAQIAYHNGFLVASQGNNTSYANSFIGKYPALDVTSEMSLGSIDSPLMPPISCNAESVICGANEQPIHNISISNGPASSLQQTSSVKVIVQEGAS
ncbi:INO80 complex subunit D [Trichonephila inaurata madagascariensis]|uniref:INO80 complex subunit D n=1 Tax=Trichonephila inaurata madagascariensis TaxID=2747483 RepID=A0A8X6WPD3_9ARAC|nr:INO80 complex subunit D [Trichonephila inaurata madagascariensis]